MSVSAWVELDGEGNVLRASDAVRQGLVPLYGADLGLPALVARRLDLAAALARKAGRVRVALGHGATLAQYDLSLDPGAVGVRVGLEEAPEFDRTSTVGRWAEVAREGVVVTDVDGHILWANDAFCRLVGYTEGEVTGRSISVFRSAKVTERTLQHQMRELTGRGAWRAEVPYRRSDGTEFTADVSVTALADEERRTTHHVFVIADITMQEEQERLESLDASATLLGRMARGFAHDLNNLAGELVALVELAQSEGDLRTDGLDQLSRIGSSLGNVGRQLLTLATHNAQPPPSDLNRLAADLGWLLTRAAERTRTIELQIPESPLWVDVQGDALLRAVLQPALRAVLEAPPDEAMVISTAIEGDEGVLRLSYVADSSERERLRALFPEGGISSHTSNALLTRAMAARVGLGLELGQGGLVSIRAAAPLMESRTLEFPPPIEEKPERVGRALVIEDNDALQELLVTALRRDFPATLAAMDGFEGLDALERVDGRVDIVVVDLMMPRMQGLEFLRRARSRWPALRVIMMSGAASADQIAEAGALGALAVLAKPFPIRELRKVIAGALGEA